MPSVCSRRVFTLPHIPKGSRGCLDLLSRVEGSSSLVLETGDSSSSWSEGSLVVEVWDGVLVEADRIISVSTSSGSSVAEASVPRSKRVLEEGQYRKVYHLGVSPPLRTIGHFELFYPQAPPLPFLPQFWALQLRRP